jgi:hypothetical protein
MPARAPKHASRASDSGSAAAVSLSLLQKASAASNRRKLVRSVAWFCGGTARKGGRFSGCGGGIGCGWNVCERDGAQPMVSCRMVSGLTAFAKVYRKIL